MISTQYKCITLDIESKNNWSTEERTIHRLRNLKGTRTKSTWSIGKWKCTRKHLLSLSWQRDWMMSTYCIAFSWHANETIIPSGTRVNWMLTKSTFYGINEMAQLFSKQIDIVFQLKWRKTFLSSMENHLNPSRSRNLNPKGIELRLLKRMK